MVGLIGCSISVLGDYSKDGGKPLSSLVGPLAALAFIGSAAAISTSPILLTLAVLSSGRKRRDLEDERVENPLTEEMKEKLQEMEILEKYLANVISLDDIEGVFIGCNILFNLFRFPIRVSNKKS